MLEVIAETLEDARQALQGGAQRLEIVRDLAQDGLTPSVDLVRQIAAEVPLPLRVMARDTNDFSASALDRTVEFAAKMAEQKVDGLVVGYLSDGRLDRPALDAIIAAAPGVPITFHRAFDALASDRLREETLDELLAIPAVDRILTSGGAGSWEERADRLDRWQRLADESKNTSRAGKPLTILAGGGMTAEGVRILRQTTTIREFHVGSAARTPANFQGRVDAAQVRAFRRDAGLP